MHSDVSGGTYRIFVYEPAAAAPLSGYPSVVALDGNMTFPIMATVAATFALTGKDALVVGVGYPTDDVMELFRLRNGDLTGGAENFYRFLTEELRPAVAEIYPVNPGDRTLYGHSMAGMFVTGVLLKHPESFRNFIASSPSLWWNERSTFREVPEFLRIVQAREVAPRVLIMVGGREQDVPDELPGSVIDGVVKRIPFAPGYVRKIVAKVVMKKKMLEYRMIGNARKLAGLLRASFHIFEGEDHLTALPASIGRALAFVLRR